MTAMLAPDAGWRTWPDQDKAVLRDRLRLARDLKLQPKQQLAEHLAGQADELLMGGAAGGGKSHWLIAHVTREMLDHPGNRGVVFRRVYPSLERTIIPRARALLHGRADWNGAKRTFTFPNGSVLELASLQYAEDVLAYQGAEYGVIAWEEVTEFLVAQYDFLRTRLRSPAEGIRPHMIATTNPGGVGHAWVKRRWVKPDPLDLAEGQTRPAPMEVWTPPPTDTDPEPRSRCFVPARLEDNPKLVERDPGYRNRLRALPNQGLRRALELGDWDAIEAVEGALWTRAVIDLRRVRSHPQLAQVVVAVDPSGGAGEQGIVVVGKGYDGHGYILADRTCRLDPIGWARRAVAAYHEHQADLIVAERNYGGDMVASTIATVDDRIPVEMVTATRGKRVRAEPVSTLYAEGWVHHVGEHPELEDQLCTWTPESGTSPDRLDACVWGVTRLLIPEDKPATAVAIQWR